MTSKTIFRPAERIRQIASEKIKAFTGTIGPNNQYLDKIYRSQKSVAQQIASDYGRRFLLELVQNGYDAHPSENQNGEIKIFFDPNEEDFGVLYVANRGCGFCWEDVEALTEIGLTGKPVGQSIGNKGLGFRSVLYISENPEIYSRISLGPSSDFDGYCFRFAGPDDFDRLIEDPVHCQLAKQDIPPFRVPIPLIQFTKKVKEFASEGFVTVIRLPLLSSHASVAIIEEIDSLRESPAPLHLFLRKLASLEFTVKGDPDRSFFLKRSSKSIPIICEEGGLLSDSYEFVTLEGGKRYFIAWHWISEELVKQKIEESIEQKELHEDWKDWEGDGEVAVAVRLDADINQLLYTFLPMGPEAKAPLYGYLHGSFYPKTDRKSLNADIPINDLYLKEAVRLCARSIISVRKIMERPNPPLTLIEAGKIIIDLLTWEPTSGVEFKKNRNFPALLHQTFDEMGYSLLNSDLLPCLKRLSGISWGRPGELWWWDYPNLKAFDANNLIARSDVAIMPTVLGEDRYNRLTKFLKRIDEGLQPEPSNENLLQAIEGIAKSLKETKALHEDWNSFYLELPIISKERRINWHHRKILLCDDGELHFTSQDWADGVNPNLDSMTVKRRGRRPKSEEIEVFIPRERSEPLPRRPRELTKGFAFLTSDLNWHETLKQAKDFLQANNLVRAYDSEEIINHLSNLVRQDPRNKVRRKALDWAFRIYKASEASRSISLRNARLYVPTIKGEWCEAREAIFSAGWPNETLGDITHEFLLLTSCNAEELHNIRNNLIASPNTPPFSRGEIDDWVKFLSQMRVVKGIQPIALEPREFKISRSEIITERIAQKVGFKDGFFKNWDKEIKISGEPKKSYGNNYKLKGNLWYFPGQNQHEAFSDEAKILFSRLVLHWLESDPSEYLRVIFYDSDWPNASPFTWPTPLLGFLRQAPWFPMETPHGFFIPKNVWLPEEDSVRLRPYLPQVHRKVRRLLTKELIAKHLVQWCNANFLNSQNSLEEQVDFLGRLFTEMEANSRYEREFLNLYHETWRQLARREHDWGDNNRPKYLILRKKGNFISLSLLSLNCSKENEKLEIYVRDGDDDLVISLMETMGFHIFDAGSENASGIAKVIQSLLGECYRPASKVLISLILDGREWADSQEEAVPISKQCPWLPIITCLAMDRLTGPAAQHLKTDRSEILMRLERIRLCTTTSLFFSVNGGRISLPEKQNGSFPFVEHGSNRTLIIECVDGCLNWENLALASKDLAKLLGLQDLEDSYRIAFRTLQRLNQPLSTIQNEELIKKELYRDLGIDPIDAERALKILGDNITSLINFIRPVVHYITGDKFDDYFSAKFANELTKDELSKKLAYCLEGTGFNEGKIIEACQNAETVGDLRDLLGFNFAKFNESLIAIGEDADLYPEVYLEVINNYIFEHRNEIMDCLRYPYISLYNIFKSLSQYVQLRNELDKIRPRKEWLVSFKIPPEDVLKALVNEWLVNRGAPSLGFKGSGLRLYSEVQDKNRKFIGRFVQNYCNIIRAWCRKNNVNIPGVWQEPNNSREEVCKLLNSLGVLDFAKLTEEVLISWLETSGSWPTTMPRTIDIGKLSLNDNDLSDEKQYQQIAKQNREKESRSIELNGAIVDPLDVDFEALSSEIHSNLPKEIISNPFGETIKLELMKEKVTSPGAISGGSGGSSGGGKGQGKIHPLKIGLIGYLGECAVYHWLKSLFPKLDIDKAWVSKYREHLFLEEGDDKLGYDFKIKVKGQTWFLEVKSSQGDPTEFELRESQVRFARDCAGKKGKEFRILYVSNVQFTNKMRIEMLPNPLSDEGRLHFRLGDRGLFYEFRRPS